MAARTRVLHVVPDLNAGVATKLLSSLLSCTDRRQFQPAVVSFGSPAKIESAPVIALNKRPGIDLKLFPRLRRILADFEPHIVHTHHPSVLPYTWPVVSLANTRTAQIHTIHGSEKTNGRLNGWLRNRAFRSTVTPVAAGAQPIPGALHIPMGVALRDLATHPGAAKESQRFDPADFLFLCPDALHSHHPSLLQAIARIASTGAKLLLIDGGNQQGQIEVQAKSLGLASQVRFVPWNNELFAAADVVVLSNNEDGDVSIMEAMAAGKACVATSASRIEDNRNGILAKPNDPDSLADAMARLVDSPHLRERLGYAARELAVAEFDHRTAVRAYESLYGRLLTQTELAMAHSG